MSTTIQSVVIPVTDLAAAKSIYTTLFGDPHTDQPYYVGFNVNGFEIALNPAGGTDGPVAYADVDDLDSTREALIAAGAVEVSEPRRVSPESRICVLADADGNPIGLRSH